MTATQTSTAAPAWRVARHRRRRRPRRRHRGRRRRVPHGRARRGHRQRSELCSRHGAALLRGAPRAFRGAGCRASGVPRPVPGDRGRRPGPAPVRPAHRDARRDGRRQRHRPQLVGGRRAVVRWARRRGDARVPAGGAGPDHDGAGDVRQPVRGRPGGDHRSGRGAVRRSSGSSPSPRRQVTFTAQEHAGVTIQVDDSSGMAYALTDDQLLFATSADDIVAALDAHASSSTTLSEAGSITALTDALPDEWLVFGIYDFTDVIASAFEGPAAASPGADVMRDLMAGQPLRGAMALTVDGDRVSLPMVSDAPTGAFAVTNADRGLADEVPGDALYYAEGGNVGEVAEQPGPHPEGGGRHDARRRRSARHGRGRPGREPRGDRLPGSATSRPSAAMTASSHGAARSSCRPTWSRRAARWTSSRPSPGSRRSIRRSGSRVDQRDVEGVEVTSLTLAGSERHNRARSGDAVRAARGRRRVGRHRRPRPPRRRRPIRRARPRPGRRQGRSPRPPATATRWPTWVGRATPA